MRERERNFLPLFFFRSSLMAALIIFLSSKSLESSSCYSKKKKTLSTNNRFRMSKFVNVRKLIHGHFTMVYWSQYHFVQDFLILDGLELFSGECAAAGDVVCVSLQLGYWGTVLDECSLAGRLKSRFDWKRGLCFHLWGTGARKKHIIKHITV